MSAARRIPMQACASRRISEYGYDAETKTLAIRFQAKSGPGALYEYSDVPPAVYEGLAGAESKGVFFGANIRAKFPFQRINETEKEGETQ